MGKFGIRQTATGRWSVVNLFTHERVATFVHRVDAEDRADELNAAWIAEVYS